MRKRVEVEEVEEGEEEEAIGRGKKNSNSPHAAHVSREVEDLVASRHDLLAVVVDAEVDEVELVAKLLLLLIVFFF